MTKYSSIEVSGVLPSSLDVAMAAFLEPYIGGVLNDSALLELRKLIRDKKVPEYDHAWASFNYLYFSSNFLKASLAARVSSGVMPNRGLRLLDLGCGAGASTAGFISGLHEAGCSVSHVTAVDRNRPQLDAFCSVVKPWIFSSFENIEVDVIESDFVAYVRDGKCDYDVVILSYSLSELAEGDRLLVRSSLLTSNLGKGGIGVVIESDPGKGGVGLEFIGGIAEVVPYDEVNFKCPHIAGLGLNVLPKFSERASSEIFDKYVKCWESHDIDMLDSLFNEECRYEINGARILNGIAAVREYWAHNSVRQRNVNVSYVVLLSTVNSVIVEWVANFDRIDTDDHRQLLGMMVMDLMCGRIKSLREVYVQHATPKLI